jgi:mannonate dehydratase
MPREGPLTVAMRLALGQSARVTDEWLAFGRQLGLTGVQLNTPELEGDEVWELPAIRELVDRVSGAGLKLEMIENVPLTFYDQVMLGGPRKEKQLENLLRTVSNLGAAEVPVLGLHFLPMSVWRTGLGATGRGGAVVSSYDHSLAADESRRDLIWVARRDLRTDSKDSWQKGSITYRGVVVNQEQMWSNLRDLVDALAPVAEASGVKIAFHPDDPPVDSSGGISNVLNSIDALNRLVGLTDSPNIGVNLCLGTLSELGGRDTVLEAIEAVGTVGRIHCVHMRDVYGVLPVFTECFLDEGNYDPAEALQALARVGYEGIILDDHTPGLTGDDAYGYRGRAHALGYLQALLDHMPKQQSGTTGMGQSR